MDAFVLMNLQSTFSLVLFILLGRWYVAPRLASRPLTEALTPLLWVHIRLLRGDRSAS